MSPSNAIMLPVSPRMTRKIAAASPSHRWILRKTRRAVHLGRLSLAIGSEIKRTPEIRQRMGLQCCSITEWRNHENESHSLLLPGMRRDAGAEQPDVHRDSTLL